MAAGRYVHMRASTADRDRSIEVLKASFVEGRLTKDELDLRLGRAFLSRFFAELMAITADLPVGPFGRLPAHPVTPAFPRARWRVPKVHLGSRGPGLVTVQAGVGEGW